MDFLSLPAIAEHLGISLSLVRKLARAAELAAEVRAGKRQLDDVPPAMIRYLNSGFPVPKRIGATIRRVRADELERWLT
jgi:hypothetical protein